MKLKLKEEHLTNKRSKNGNLFSKNTPADIRRKASLNKYPKPSDYKKPIQICDTLLNGYKIFCDMEHPLCQLSNGTVYLHRHVASVRVGYWITRYEEVHHRDKNKKNNKPDNLRIINKQDHSKEHGFKPHGRKPKVKDR